jgi:hypothetical protein
LVNGGGIVTGQENTGDLGYTYGTYIFKDKDKDGKLVTAYGKTPPSGRNRKMGWKVVMDMGNSSPAPKSQ